MRRLAAVLLAALTVPSACSSPEPDAGPTPDAAGPGTPTTATPAPAEVFTLGVVASTSGPTAAVDQTFLDGMRLAEREVNAAGGVAERPLQLSVVDDEGRDARTRAALGRLLRSGRAHALLVIGEGSAISAHRSLIEEAERPVFLLGGDLYSTRSLFRWVFQTSAPYRWRARVLARYFARDRGYGRVALVTEAGDDAARAREAILEELRAEGLTVDPVLTTGAAGTQPTAPEAANADALIAFTERGTARSLARGYAEGPGAPQLALAAPAYGTASLPAGTVAPATYAWAGWADPIPRVGHFRARLERAAGHPPEGFEQEGYDAVRLLAAALDHTGGESGEALLRALESNRPQGPTHAELPLVLGPDDHTTTDETYLGIFAVAAPGEEPEPWVPDDRPWRPIIRTFTSDGERTIFHERDRRVFFPFWRKDRPSPKYFRSRYGITSRAAADPLH